MNINDDDSWNSWSGRSMDWFHYSLYLQLKFNQQALSSLVSSKKKIFSLLLNCIVLGVLYSHPQQESSPAWTQEAYRPPCSKWLLCCSVSWQGGYPHPVPIGGGVLLPSSPYLGGAPSSSLNGGGVPPSSSDGGYSRVPPGRKDGGYPLLGRMGSW